MMPLLLGIPNSKVVFCSPYHLVPIQPQALLLPSRCPLSREANPEP